MRDIFTFDYPAHKAFIGEARRTPEVWRMLCGIALMLFAQWMLLQIIWQGLFVFLSDDSYSALFDDFDTMDLPQSAFVVLYSFIAIWISVVLAALVLHGRGFASLIGSRRLAVFQVRSGMPSLIGLSALGLGLLGLGPEPLKDGLPLGMWLVYLIPALIGVLIQTSAEEVLFRGYLQQQLAARFSSPVVWMILPSALFGLLHYQPADYGANAWLVVIWAMIFGVIAADLTARSGTLGPAIALHFVTNVSAFLVVAPQGPLSGLALFQLPFATSDVDALRAYLPIDLMMLILGWLALRLALRR